jgi:serine protease Do
VARIRISFITWSTAFALGIPGILLGGGSTGCTRDANASTPSVVEAPADSPLLSLMTGGSSSTSGIATGYDPRVSLAPMIEKVGPQVVSVHAEGARRDPRVGFFGGGGTSIAQSHGSGFVYSADGLVVTNHHVVDGAERVRVRMSDGRELAAKVLGSDPSTDLALVQIEGASGLAAATLGESSGARVGDWVVAIGSPMGLEHSASVGIVSAKGRGSLGLYADSYLDFLQTDADIAPGSSGGPLFDLEGRVIGINTAVGPGDSGFAIPIDQAKEVIPKLQKDGKVVRGWLGAANNEAAKGRSGAQIGRVYEDTPAANAGLREGDVVTKVDGKAVVDFEDLRGRIAELGPGHTALLEVMRDGKTIELSVVLAERPAADAFGELRRAPASPSPRVTPAPAPAPRPGSELRLGVQVKPSTDGLAIATIEPESLADRIGLQSGDVLRSINGESVNDAADVPDALRKDGDRLSVDVVRDGSVVTLSMRLSS